MPTDRVHDPRHKLTDLPEWRSTDPTGLAGPGGAVQTANGARRRQGTHTTSPGAGHTYNEAGASRAQQHDRAPAS